MAARVEDNISTPGDWGDISPWDAANDGAPYWFDQPIQQRWHKLIKDMLLGSEATPDVPDLSQYNSHYVFVYGTLKRGHTANDLMREGIHLGKAWTKLKCFLMVNQGVPAVLFTTSDKRKAIGGDIYQVDIPTLKKLDVYESNGVLYQRKCIHVEAEDGQVYKAWMYIGKGSVFSERTGRVCESFTRSKNNLPYYAYTKTSRG